MYLTIIMSLIFCLTIFFMKTINPLSMGLILVVQTLLSSVLLGSMTKTFWMMYLLILTFIGGMLVLFIYVTSIFPNEKFSFNQQSSFMYMYVLLTTFFTLFIYSLLYDLNLNFLDHTFNFPASKMGLLYTMKMFNSFTSLLLIFLVIYLFYTMLVVIKITNFHQGPLRKMNYV